MILLSWKTLWYEWLKYLTWNRSNVSIRALENPLAFSLLVTLASVADSRQKTQLGAYNRHLQKVGQPTVLAHAADNRTWGFTSSTLEFNSWLHWTEVDLFPRILLEPSGSKAAVDKHLYSLNLLNSGNWTGFTSGTPALHSFTYQDVGEPTCHPCSTTGMYAGFPLISAMGTLEHLSSCGNRYVVVKRY